MTLLSCQPEDMRSNRQLGQQPDSLPVEGASPGTYQGGDDPGLLVDEATDDLGGFVNNFTQAPPLCPNPTVEPKSLSVDGQNRLDDLIRKAFNEDISCKKVFTGNGSPQSDRSEYPDITYTKVIGYSMAEDMCADNKIYSTFQGKFGDADALNESVFDDGKSENNFAATYALLYGLGQRESSGNFNQWKDLGATNSGMEEEAGFTQTSANSLNAHSLMRDIFRTYVTKLSAMTDMQQRASYCLADKMAGNTQTRIQRHAKDLYGVRSNYPTSGEKLDELFQNADSKCKSIESSIQGDFRVNKNKNSMIECFKDLHKMCPGFSIKFGAASARLNRRHHGPLMPARQTKPSPKPSCHMLFNSIVANKEQICKDLNSPKDESEKTIGDQLLALNKDPEQPGSGLIVSADQKPDPEKTFEFKNDQPIDYLKPSEQKPFAQTPEAAESFVIGISDNGTQAIIPHGTRLEIVRPAGNKHTYVKHNDTIFKVPNREVGLPEKEDPENNEEADKELVIISRKTWDPNFKIKNHQPLGDVMRVTLHHSEGNYNSTDAQELAMVKSAHLVTNGWSDIGYHYIIPRGPVNNGGYSGDVYEGRDVSKLGIHTKKNNTGNIGIVLLGNFHPYGVHNRTGSKTDVPKPTAYQVAALKKLMKKLRSEYPNLTPLKGHGQYKKTTCPGDNVQPLIDLINSER